MTPDEILDAVARGWFPEDIEAAPSKYHLEGDNDGLSAFRENVRNGEVLPVVNTKPKPRNFNTSKVRHGAQVFHHEGDGNDAMRHAFAVATAAE